MRCQRCGHGAGWHTSDNGCTWLGDSPTPSDRCPCPMSPTEVTVAQPAEENRA